MGSDQRTEAAAALLVGVIAISWSAIFVRWAHMPGISSAFYRLLIACPVLWLLRSLTRKTCAPLEPRSILLASLGGLFFAADVGCYNVAVLRTAAGSATFLGNNAPLAVGLFTWIFLKEKPSRRFWTALSVATVGASLIVSMDLKQFRAASSGDLLAVSASICFALYLLVTERIRGTVDTITIVTFSTTASAIALFAFSILSRSSLTILTASSAAALVGLGLLCQLTGYFCLTYALGHLQATVSSVVMLAVAPLTALLAFILFGEHMVPLQLLGGALILTAVWIVTQRNTEKLATTVLQAKPEFARRAEPST